MSSQRPPPKHHHFGNSVSAYEFGGGGGHKHSVSSTLRTKENTGELGLRKDTTRWPWGRRPWNNLLGPPWNKSVLFLPPGGSLQIKIPTKETELDQRSWGQGVSLEGMEKSCKTSGQKGYWFNKIKDTNKFDLEVVGKDMRLSVHSASTDCLPAQPTAPAPPPQADKPDQLHPRPCPQRAHSLVGKQRVHNRNTAPSVCSTHLLAFEGSVPKEGQSRPQRKQ